MRKLLLLFLLCFGTADGQRFIVEDSGGLRRELTRICVEDSGGTTRCIQRMFVSDSGGVERLVFVGETVTLSGQVIGAAAFNTQATAAVRISTDGNVYQLINGSATQIDTITDWLRPVGNEEDYQVRFTNLVGDHPSSTPVGVDVNEWHPLSSGTITWQNADTTFDDGPDNSSFTIQIRKGTGAVEAQATYELNPNSSTF